MSDEHAPQGSSPEWHPRKPLPGELRYPGEPFEFQRRTGPEVDQPGEPDSLIEDLRQKLEEIHGSPSVGSFESSLHFPLHRFSKVRSYTSPEERQKHFIDNVAALKSLSGDVPMTTKNPILRVGGIVLDIIRFPVNPIDNARRAKESLKGIARNLPFAKKLKILQEVPEDAAVTLSNKQQKAEHQITTSLSQMRKDALPYDGNNPFIRWVINTYAKRNINMPAAKALSWFAAGNTPLIGFLISSGKLYVPNVVAPLYERKFQRAIKTFVLTGTDFAANIFQSARAVVMTHGALDLFATHGIGRGLLALPAYLLSNWEILAPYPIILAYNPLFIQGRLDQNDYRMYSRHFEGMHELLWNGAQEQTALVRNGVKGMLEDYGKNHPDNTLLQNAEQLSCLMQSEYNALVERLDDEKTAIESLYHELCDISEEHDARKYHKIERKIAELSLRNKAHRARLLYIENLHLLMQETGFLPPPS